MSGSFNTVLTPLQKMKRQLSLFCCKVLYTFKTRLPSYTYTLDLIRSFNGYRHYYDKHNMMGLTTCSGLKVYSIKMSPFLSCWNIKKPSLLPSSLEKLFLWICNTSVVMDTTTRYTVAWKCFLIHLKWHKRKNK